MEFFFRDAETPFSHFSKNVSVLSHPRQNPLLVCIVPKIWSPCLLLSYRRNVKVSSFSTVSGDLTSTFLFLFALSSASEIKSGFFSPEVANFCFQTLLQTPYFNGFTSVWCHHWSWKQFIPCFLPCKIYKGTCPVCTVQGSVWAGCGQ